MTTEPDTDEIEYPSDRIDFKTLCGWALVILAAGVSVAPTKWAGVDW